MYMWYMYMSLPLSWRIFLWTYRHRMWTPSFRLCTARFNKRNNPEHVYVLHDGTLWKTNKNKQLLLLIRIRIIMRCKRTIVWTLAVYKFTTSWNIINLLILHCKRNVYYFMIVQIISSRSYNCKNYDVCFNFKYRNIYLFIYFFFYTSDDYPLYT